MTVKAVSDGTVSFLAEANAIDLLAALSGAYRGHLAHVEGHSF